MNLQENPRHVFMRDTENECRDTSERYDSQYLYEQNQETPTAANFMGYLVAFSAALGGLLFGYEVGVISQVLGMPGFKRTFRVDVFNGIEFVTNKNRANFMDSLTTFTFLAGCFVGAIIVSDLADSLGRKKSIIIGGLSFIFGGVFQTFAGSVGVYFFGRCAGGVGIGILSMCSPLYISEAAPTHLRGQMITIQQLMITVGILVSGSINSIIILATEKSDPKLEWRLAMGLQCVPALLLVLVMVLMPESPRWLIRENRLEEAIETIARLRSLGTSSAMVAGEMHDIQHSVMTERKIGNGQWAEVFVPGMINRLVIVLVLQMFQQLTGINVIMYYQVELLEAMGFSRNMAAIPLTLANDIALVLCTLPGMYMIEKWGRRKLLLIGGAGMAIAHFGISFFVKAYMHSKISAFGWGPVIFMYVFIFFFSSTWGPVVWAYQSEVFPLRIRAKGTGAGTMSNWGFNALVALINPYIQEAIPSYTDCIYGTFCILSVLFVFKFVPETMGKSLEQMDEVFGSSADTNLKKKPVGVIKTSSTESDGVYV